MNRDQEPLHKKSRPFALLLLLLPLLALVCGQGDVAPMGRVAAEATVPVTTPVAAETSPPLPTIAPSASAPTTTTGDGAWLLQRPEATLAALPEGVDFDALARYMLELVNQARTAEGLRPVYWDPVGAEAGRRHALDMVRHDYFSHRNRQGLGPDHRYNLAGGIYAAQENLHAFSYTYPNGRGAPIEDWRQVIRDAHEGLLQSPPHRANILNPAHTNLGIGMAYDPEEGQFRLAQEFTNQYAQLAQPLPLHARLGEVVDVQGSLLANQPLDNALLSLAYEPFPEPLTVAELNGSGIYASPAESVDVWRAAANFQRTIRLNAGDRPGLYHVRLFADFQGEQALILDRVIEVRR